MQNIPPAETNTDSEVLTTVNSDGPRPITSGNGFQVVFQNALKVFGIDRAIAYTLAGQGWNVISGPLTLFLLARFLHPDEQGFYFTFSSVIALNIFFELGLTYVLVQFASHEKAHLEWTGPNTLSGSDGARARLAALLKLACRWYAVAALLVMVALMPGGLLFFAKNASAASVAWRIPWIWLATASAMNLLTLPLLAVIEGCGKITHLASMRAGQNITSSIGLWLTLWFHGALYAGSVMQTVNVVYAAIWIVIFYRRFFKTLLAVEITDTSFNWGKEVWPFQWRIAISWLSGYFIFQLFNPVLFATHGAVVAGQMGMSITICNALIGISMAWMSTKASPFGVLVARRQWKDLDQTFFKTLRQSLLVLLAGCTMVFLGALLLNHWDHPYAKRILRPLPLSFLLIASVMNNVVFCEAQYLRAHKNEPFLWLSIAVGVITAVSIYFLAKPFAAFGVSAGYLACSTILLTAGTGIFIQKRKEWHA